MNRAMRAMAPFVLLAALLIASFASPTAQAAGPTLTIVSPADGSVIGNATPIVVVFTVSNFALVQPGRVGQIVSPTEGHLNVFVDGQLARLLVRVEPIELSLPSGPPTVRLQLVTSDGAPLTPDV